MDECRDHLIYFEDFELDLCLCLNTLNALLRLCIDIAIMNLHRLHFLRNFSAGW